MKPDRPLEPTTAEHDRQTGRDLRYWRDIDDETFKDKVREMSRRISQTDTFGHTNRMARHVHYGS